jgi:hypothetical protein
MAGSHELSGQATTLIAVLLLGGVQLISLGILGEYIGRIYDEAKGRPLYITRETPEDFESRFPEAPQSGGAPLPGTISEAKQPAFNAAADRRQETGTELELK